MFEEEEDEHNAPINAPALPQPGPVPAFAPFWPF